MILSWPCVKAIVIHQTIFYLNTTRFVRLQAAKNKKPLLFIGSNGFKKINALMQR